MSSANMIYLADDGNWGDAKGLLVFSSYDLPDEMFQMLQDDPEAAYDDIRLWLINEGKI